MSSRNNSRAKVIDEKTKRQADSAKVIHKLIKKSLHKAQRLSIHDGRTKVLKSQLNSLYQMMVQYEKDLRNGVKR